MRNSSRLIAVPVALASALCVLAVGSSPADAKVTRTTTHRVELIWSSSIRFIRVDQGYKILDKDQDAGYILFEFEEDDRTFRGSIELVPGTDSQDRPFLRIVVTLIDRPTYMEELVMRRLLTKIREEHGQAPTPRPKKPPATDKPETDNDKKPAPKRAGPPPGAGTHGVVSAHARIRARH